MDKKGPEKKARLLAALDKGMVMIHLDARRPGVLVPPSLRNEAHLRLNLSYRFEPPDLAVGEWGVRCTLSFSGSRFKVAVPWSALFAVTSHVTKEFWMYPDDMPAELIQQTMVTTKASVPEPVAEQVAPPEERPRAVLREVERQEERQEESREPVTPPAEAEGPKDEPPAPRRGHLRLVK
ncbi:ClpXP protease specificity-enhancing factor SspB [Archangium sp.]|uniref:ClpXP protease specificity-enhancing factor SspB n=1 Tax=Archangium sp. TaxID=1872627 RepID=UPI002D6C8DAB|nr:ClpXP protease specificity-enhancing factor SspB [Archangium sp.]HYO59934.1 ClpXP protease specificity-enhancing factor SspB [Archangium sp.]